MPPNSECLRVADQLRRAFSGDPWHGPALRELLADVSVAQARSRPLPSAHTIWELVVHIDMYVQAAFEAVQGNPMPRWYGSEMDWPEKRERGDEDWTGATDSLFHNAERLAHAIELLKDASLQVTVPGRDYDFYHLFHGVVQHSLYHGGQIAVLKRVVSAQ
jgi:hypothetical protein